MTPAIHILNASALSDQILITIGRSVEQVFHLPVKTSHHALEITRAYDSSRGQCNSTVLLSQVLALQDDTGTKLVAVVDIDLYIPVLTFVFGEAQFQGTAAIVSTHRLANQYYGLPRDDRLLFHRLEKEIVHELGHVFGLYHCRQFECVMRSSTYVEEIDLKRSVPCDACNTFLSHNIHQLIRSDNNYEHTV